ncbi:hypothetical protein PR003_g30688 [Phytophthora rubi]|uniref:CCHC-type domain-containing protein n=1 Tax=Phytophthora rubi TaxID=129364 RepID=A0A6A3H008_9STRA|nr:hypothetical protein PR001_g29681 [Phytophthora rubi]KAE9270875.1 hypothetical protein PR003_g30688 [Phytophthora rubi]
MDLGMAEQSDIRYYGCGKLGHMKRACPAGGLKKKFSSKPFGSRGRVVSGNAGAAAADVATVAAFRIDETSLGNGDRMCGVALIGQENPAAE